MNLSISLGVLVPLTAASLAAGLLAGCGKATPAPPEMESPFRREILDEHYEPYGFVAHALGTVDGLSYTNTLEAFQRSYALGFRIFETDLVLLADGVVLAAHNNTERHYGLDKPFSEATRDEVSPRYRGRYTALFEDDLLRLVDEHPDVFLILDSKGRRLSTVIKIVERIVEVGRERFPRALERIVPHVSYQQELDILRQVYPFPDYMLALYRCPLPNQELPDFVRRNHLHAVMMWWDKRYTPELDASLRAAGAVTYVHSLDSWDKIDRFRALGVGVYSDGLYPSPESGR